LCSKIHKGIIAAFYQSQDGNIKFKGNIWVSPLYGKMIPIVYP
jgi:hypothetical protein